MRSNRATKRQSGMSLLEVMIAMLLLTGTMVGSRPCSAPW